MLANNSFVNEDPGQIHNDIEDPSLITQMNLTRELIERRYHNNEIDIAEHISDIEYSFEEEKLGGITPIDKDEFNLTGLQRLWVEENEQLPDQNDKQIVSENDEHIESLDKKMIN